MVGTMTSARRSPILRILNHPVFQWVVSIYIAIVLVTYGVALIRFTPTLDEAIGSGFMTSFGEMEAYTSRAFFGGSEYRFKLKGSGGIFTIFPGTLSSGADMPEGGAGLIITHTVKGNWVVELTNKNAPGAPIIVNKSVATQSLESAVKSAYWRAVLSFVFALMIGAFPIGLRWVRKRLKA